MDPWGKKSTGTAEVNLYDLANLPFRSSLGRFGVSEALVFAGRPWAGTVVTPLSVETCLEEPPEPAGDGADGDVIWAMGVTVFLGEFNHRITMV